MAAVAQKESIHDEQALGKAYDGRLLRRLWIYISPHSRLIWISLAILPLLAGVEIIQPLIVKYGIDQNLSQRKLDGLAWVALAFAVALVAHTLLQYLYLYILSITGQRAMRGLRSAMFEHLQRLPNRYLDRNPIGRIMTRLTNDVEALNEMFTSGLVSLVGDFVKMTGIVVVMLSVNARLSLVTFSIVPVLFLVAWFFRMRMRDAYRAIRVKIARINSYLQESLSGMQIVQLYVREKHNLAEFEEVNAEHRDANFLSIKYDALLFAVVEAAGRLTIALVIWYGAGLVYTRILGERTPGMLEAGITIGTLYAFIDWIGKFFEPIRDLSAKYTVMQAAMAASERIFQLLDTPVEIDEPSDPVRLDRVRGEIEFRNVTFAYNPGDVILHDVSFIVKPGEKIALVGHTGAGKTSIIKLLARFYEPQSGQIFLDGVDIR
ncbi:MAG: ABC transporter transmembrane domain-containing protein, partial [Deltaproteobacteria bacterium]|nr:ABC transporter transmembrane domain-containing protein [Deltaproteobacteria bacterium]